MACRRNSQKTRFYHLVQITLTYDKLSTSSVAGWKNERLALEDEAGDWKVLRVRPGDPKRHWEKADAVREVVDAALGIAAGPLRQAAASEAYLMVAEKRVVGFLLAEPLEASDRLERSFLRGGSRVVASPGKVS